MRNLLVVPMVVSTLITARIALSTDFNSPPDEVMHVDAMCFFESHWWPPALNQDGLIYSPDGWSRVYNGEVVYLLYGRIGSSLKPLAQALIERRISASATGSQSYRIYLPAVRAIGRCATIFQMYRLLNVLLLAGTLLVILAASRRNMPVALLGLTLLCIPQVLYVYAYANSDAWGLSLSIMLFVYLMATRATIGSTRFAIVLGLAAGLLLLAKETFWLILPWALLMASTRHLQQPTSFVAQPPLRQVALSAAIMCFTALAVSAPLKILYPLSQGNWDAQTEQMRTARARFDFQPAGPINPGYHMAARGQSIADVLQNGRWIELSLKSAYGYFGHFAVELPTWVYAAAFWLGASNVILTAAIGWSKRTTLNVVTKAGLLSAAPMIALVLAASLYNSWTVDFQPQGRYLFSAIPPLTFLLAGTVPVENKWTIGFRVVSSLAAYVLSAYALLAYAAP